MGVPPTTYLLEQSSDNSEFCELTESQSLDMTLNEEEMCGVTVYNLGECEYPQGVKENEEYYAIMDVGEPVTITAKRSLLSTTFTTYLIRVETNYPTFTYKFSAVRRRYQEFCWLRDELVRNHRDRKVPPLPPKTFLSFKSFNATFIQERLRGLSIFLQRVLENPTFLKDQSLLFFLQTDVSIQELEQRKRQARGSSSSSSSSPLLAYLSHEEEPQQVEVPPPPPSSYHTEDEEEQEDLDDTTNVADKSVLSSSFNSSQGSERLRASAKPIPVPLQKKEHISISGGRSQNKLKALGAGFNRLSHSSEGDSGHFEASSSGASRASTSPTFTIPDRYRDHHEDEEEDLPDSREKTPVVLETPVGSYHRSTSYHRSSPIRSYEDHHDDTPAILPVSELFMYNPVAYCVVP